MNPPSWPAIAIAAGAFLLLGLAISSFLRSLRRAAQIEQAIALTRPAGNPPHETPKPRVLYTVRAWEDGRIRMWDGQKNLIGEHIPDRPADWDGALKRLINDLRD